MSKKIKNEQKKFLGETLNQYDKALNEGINQLDKKNREQNHKISSLVNSFDNEFLEKDVEGNMTALENSKDGMVIINEIQGNTEVNYCKDGEKELILNGDIDTQGESFVTITEGVDGGLVDVSLEGNTEINLSNTKDPVLVTREFDDINCNAGKLQYTIDDVTTINDEPGKVDIDRIVGDTMVNHAVNGSEELILNAHINESGDNNITLNGVTSDGGKVDVALEGNTLVNVSNVKDDYITPTIEDKVDQGSVISLPEVSEGYINIDSIEGNTLVNYCTDGAKEMTLNGDIDVEGTFVTTTEGVDNGLVDVALEGNTLVNIVKQYRYEFTNASRVDDQYVKLQHGANENTCYITLPYGSCLYKPRTTYTLVVEIKENTSTATLGMSNIGSVISKVSSINIGKNPGKYFITFETKDDFSTDNRGVNAPVNDMYFCSWDKGGDGSKHIIFRFFILEGDWTNKEIPQYFEGMKSVGQDDVNGHKIEILSRNKNEINLPSHTYSFVNIEEDMHDGFGSYSVRLPVMGKTFSYRYDYEIISISEEQDSFITNLAGSSINNPNNVVTDFDISVVNQRLYNGAKGTVVVNNISKSETHTLMDIRCIRIEAPVTITYKITNFALYFSDNADTYIPYMENKKEILLNEPLRSLPNGVKDRFVKIGGKWFIERKCALITLNGIGETWSVALTSDGKYIRGWSTSKVGDIVKFDATDGYKLLAKNLPYIGKDQILQPYDGEGCGETFYRNNGDKQIQIKILASKLSTPTQSGFIAWLKSNPQDFIIALATPTYEPLEIEPTLNTYNEVTHISNNSIIPCNMKIKNTGYNAIIKPSTLYTIAVDTNKNETVGINLGGAKVTTTNNVATITTPETLTDDSLRLYGKGITASKVRLLEGDKTNWIPSFFEGMKSSFEDKIQEDGSYKIEVISNNKNLFDVSNISIIDGNNNLSYHTLELGINNGIKLTSVQDHQGWMYSVLNLPNLKPNTNYTFRCNITKTNPNSNSCIRIFRLLDDYDCGILHESGSFTFKTPIVGVEQLGLLVYSSRDNVPAKQGDVTYFEDIQISEVEGEYVPHKSNKIQLSSIEPLRGVNEIHDRLVFKDGKLMIERNIGEVTIKDNISYVEVEVVNNSSSSTNRIYTTRFILGRDMFPNIKLKTDYYFKSDRFKHTLWNLDVEGFSIGSNLDFNILNTRLSSLDAEGVIEWFRNNPTKFAYLLAEPTYEEIPYDLQKIILESYNNGTLFIDTNIPPTKVSFNCFEEELTYLYPATSYTVQFISDRETTADINLGGTQLLAQNIVKGLNRISITTPDTLVDSKLIINGTGAKISEVVVTNTDREFGYFEGMKSVGECGNLVITSSNSDNSLSNTQTLTHAPLRSVGETKDRYVLLDGNWYIERKCGIRAYQEGDKDNYKTDLVNTVYPLEMPIYEEIDYNPLEVYSGTTHITTNSVIPCNITVKNHGYNLVALKENTQYTLYVNKDTTNTLTYRLGDYVEINSLSKFTFTTPSTLTDKTLRIDGKGAKVKDLMLIEGTPTNDSIGYFDGLKSSYECEQVTDENDVNYGKYKVDIKVVGKNLTELNEMHNNGEGFFNASTGSFNYARVGKTYTISADYIGVSKDIQIRFTKLPSGSANNEVVAIINSPRWNLINGSRTSFTFTSHVNGYIGLSGAGHGSDAKLYNIQIEEGDIATEYEPYFESKQTIYLNSPLLKGDEIVWKDNKIQHYHKMGRVVLDGSDDEGWIYWSNNTDNAGLSSDLISFYSSNIDNYMEYRDNMYCDKFICHSTVWGAQTEIIALNGDSTIRLQLAISRSKLSTQDIEGFKQWLQANPVTVVYELNTPYYEEISIYPLKLNAIANSSLSTESTIQVTNISFNIYEETLPYLYPNTKYYITFNADVDRNNIIINLGGSHAVLDCKVGFNKVEITTPSDTTNLLTFSGTGVNIDHVKVTQQDIDEYFEGMKSVGECEDLEITSANSDNTLSNTQQFTHEPLRGINHIKDRYVIIDGKWYIERNIIKYVLNGNEAWSEYYQFSDDEVFACYHIVNEYIVSNSFKCDQFKKTAFNANDNSEGVDTYYVNNTNYVPRLKIKKYKLPTPNIDGLKAWLRQNPITIIARLASPVYEPIDYNPFETYADITHISTNSLIPTNMVIKNHGYNCILKPSTKYTIALNKPDGTISAKLGGSEKVDSTNSIFTITTPSTLNDNVLRLSGSGNVRDIMILEGDKTINTPSYFEGIESVFEQEYDAEVGKYRVTAKVEGDGKESNITFYINEPLRGVRNVKDRIFIKDGKVVVQRNCGNIILDGKAPNRVTGINPGGYHTWTNSTGNTVNGYVYFNELIEGLEKKMISNSKINCNTLPSNGGGHISVVEGIILTTNYFGFSIHKSKLGVTDVNDQQQNELKASEWFKNNPVTVVYQLAEPVYEEADCDLSKLVLENYENSSLIFESNIPVSANVRYSGEVPVVTQAKSLSSQVDNTTLDINENIIPYMCDIDYRIVELQLMNGDTQGEGIELLGIGDIEILGNENVLFNNREDKKYNYSYDMLKRDILSQRYSKEEYQYRLDRYLLANKISDEEYKELEGLLNNGE